MRYRLVVILAFVCNLIVVSWISDVYWVEIHAWQIQEANLVNGNQYRFFHLNTSHILSFEVAHDLRDMIFVSPAKVYYTFSIMKIPNAIRLLRQDATIIHADIAANLTLTFPFSSSLRDQQRRAYWCVVNLEYAQQQHGFDQLRCKQEHTLSQADSGTFTIFVPIPDLEQRPRRQQQKQRSL